MIVEVWTTVNEFKTSILDILALVFSSNEISFTFTFVVFSSISFKNDNEQSFSKTIEFNVNESIFSETVTETGPFICELLILMVDVSNWALFILKSYI